MSAVSSLADYDNRVKTLILTDDLNKQGVFAMIGHVMGIPFYILTDDILPMLWKNQMLFADVPTSGSLWVPFYQKAFAKTMGYYDRIVGGWMAESFAFTTGMPVVVYGKNSEAL